MPLKLDGARELELAGLIAEIFVRDELDELLKRWLSKPLEHFVGNLGFAQQCQTVVRTFNGTGRIEEFCSQLVLSRREFGHDIGKIIGMQVALDGAAGNSSFDPFEFLDQFDRIDECAAVDQALMKYVVPPPMKPIVIGILAERDDEFTYLIRRLNSSVINQIYQQAAWQAEPISWADSADAEYEIRMLAQKRLGERRSEFKSLIAKLGPKLAGSAIQIEISSDKLANQKTLDRLAAFLGLWAQIGEHAPPPVLYIVVVRLDDQSVALDAVKAPLANVMSRASDNLIIVEPITLSLCDPTYVDPWHDVIKSFNRTINTLAYYEFKRSLKPRFRVSELVERLRASRFYT